MTMLTKLKLDKIVTLFILINLINAVPINDKIFLFN